jgi:hypothetical protein
MLRSIFAFTALLAVAAVHAQSTITIRAANSVNNQILDVLFTQPAPPGSATVLNTDQSSLLRLESLVLVRNPDSVDLYAADNLNHEILFYQSDFCRPPETNSPCNTMGMPLTLTNPINYPNGLSADSEGNLFAVDDAPGKSPLPQVWFLTQAGVSQLLDTNTSQGGSLGQQQAVVETMIVGASLGGAANSGDLLVASHSPDAVLLYQGNGGTGPHPANGKLISPTTLVPQCLKPHGYTNCIPAGSLPQGIAVWPEDNSLLITTSSGSILKASFAGGSLTNVTTFASGLPGGLYKIKTGFSGGARAFVAQSGPGNHGSILELGRCPPNSNLPACAGNPPGIVVLGTVTTNVAAPQGIAVTNAVQGDASSCVDGVGGCDLLGGGGHTVLKHNVIGSAGLNGKIIEDLCVAVDTRPNIPGVGACGDLPKKVNDFCGANFDDTNSLYVPGYYCGAARGKNLIVVKTHIDHSQFSQFNNAYVQNAADANGVLPDDPNHPTNPVCGPPQVNIQLPPAQGGPLPIEAVLWAPQTGEGMPVAQTMLSGVGLVPAMANLENGCGDGKPGTNALSLWVFGVELDTTASELQAPYAGQPTGEPQWNVESTNYTNLLATVTSLYSASSISQTEAQLLTNTINNPISTPPGCIDNSLGDFTTATELFQQPVPGLDPNGPTAYFQAAANLMTNAAISVTPANNTTCDSIVENNLGAFTPKPLVPIWNPSGQVRSWLGPVEFTESSLILSNPAPATPSTWPPPLTINASCPDNVSCPTTLINGSLQTANGVNGSVNASNVPLNLTWAVNPPANANWTAANCTLASDDRVWTGQALPGQPLQIRPPTADGKYHQYTITCSGVPNNTTVPASVNGTISATAWVVNFAPPHP